MTPLPPAAAADRAQRLVLGLAAGAGAPTPPAEAWIPGDEPVPGDADEEYLQSRALVERITMTEQAISWLRAEQCAALAELESMPCPGPLSQRAAAEGEIAAALVRSRHAASVRLDDAGTLSRLPRVMALLRSGLIDTRRAEAVAHTMNEHLPYGDERGPAPSRRPDRDLQRDPRRPGAPALSTHASRSRTAQRSR